MPAEKGWSDATYGGSWGKPGQTERGFLLNAPFSNKFPSGGYITTPEDLVRFGEAHQGPGFLKSDTLQQLSCRGKVQAEQGAMLEIEMPRGITQEDVWKACDALLLEGARPPIERVRQKIGRGSPNTVSPYLEIWFKHLGGRMRDPGAFAAPPEVPDVVLQAAKHFWEGALAETRRDFDERLREGLAAAVSNVEAEKERGAIANAAAFEATAKAARMQGELERLQVRVQSEEQARATAELQLVSARAQIDDLRGRLDIAQDHLGKVREAAQRELAEAIKRFTAAERWAALEIDAARVTKDKAERRAETLERRMETLTEKLRAVHEEHAREAVTLQSMNAKFSSEIEHLQACEKALQQRGAGLETELSNARRLVEAASLGEDIADRLLRAMKESQTGPKKKGSFERRNPSTA